MPADLRPELKRRSAVLSAATRRSVLLGERLLAAAAQCRAGPHAEFRLAARELLGAATDCASLWGAPGDVETLRVALVDATRELLSMVQRAALSDAAATVPVADETPADDNETTATAADDDAPQSPTAGGAPTHEISEPAADQTAAANKAAASTDSTARAEPGASGSGVAADGEHADAKVTSAAAGSVFEEAPLVLSPGVDSAFGEPSSGQTSRSSLASSTASAADVASERNSGAAVDDAAKSAAGAPLSAAPPAAAATPSATAPPDAPQSIASGHADGGDEEDDVSKFHFATLTRQPSFRIVYEREDDGDVMEDDDEEEDDDDDDDDDEDLDENYVDGDDDSEIDDVVLDSDDEGTARGPQAKHDGDGDIDDDDETVLDQPKATRATGGAVAVDDDDDDTIIDAVLAANAGSSRSYSTVADQEALKAAERAKALLQAEREQLERELAELSSVVERSSHRAPDNHMSAIDSLASELASASGKHNKNFLLLAKRWLIIFLFCFHFVFCFCCCCCLIF